MHDAGDRMVVEEGAQRDDVAHIGVDRGHRTARERLQPREHRGSAVRKIVEHDRRITRASKLDDDVRAHVAGTTGHEDRF